MFHTLIAVNRIWAISHPVSYRMYHNKRTAGFLCLVALCYVHIMGLPGLVLDALYYHLPENEHGCLISTPQMPVWGRIENILCRILPLFLVMFAYAYTNALIWCRRRKRADNTVHSSHDTNPRSATANKIFALQSQADKEHHGESVVSVTRNREVKASLVLTLTVISIIVCWLPADALYFAFLFFGIGFSSTAFITVMLLYSVQSVFDPLMLQFSLRKIKQKL
ncbi:uncharacterized protein LOC129589896 [Paramacrobiotus metropolitanus]|uniref:uncharacterized protein LOC129589896 n=1 Tax=Paramacrobiotus metropolitanus TaxID=2943436 RepID=UPI0024464FCD|nr:uncharacterized protein LOC129589896 [Paramacrobiotus metropolitanus]